ncbi:sodium-dicarboxylate cotransporter-like [Canna indica]|uniref:Sodium-dicarboxylate cotransporter-like n=1 Tax=Canna indica TaxID=4628 RepID=A0AAQ3JY23_9LILI|nr:sodium-dicarboxylate cotransporter-like [Canna indica]
MEHHYPSRWTRLCDRRWHSNHHVGVAFAHRACCIHGGAPSSPDGPRSHWGHSSPSYITPSNVVGFTTEHIRIKDMLRVGVPLKIA